MRTTVWLIAVSSILASSLEVGDEVQDRLDTAIAEYESVLAKLESDVQDQLGDLFDRYADDGELEKTQKVATLRETFATEGLLPDIPLLRTIREKARVRFSKANLQLRTAYKKAIAEYTRARDLRAAEEAKKALQEFEKDSGPDRIQFPRAERKKPKQQDRPAAELNPPLILRPPLRSNAADGPAPDSTQPETGPNSAPPKSGKDSEPSEALLAVINKGPERDVLSDRLATTHAKGVAMWELLQRVCREYKVSQWTYADCDYFSALPRNENHRTGGMPMLRATGVEHGKIVWRFHQWNHNTTHSAPYGRGESFGSMIRGRCMAMWLLSAESAEEFIHRTQKLGQTNDLTSVNANLSVDEIKLWLSALGCDNRQEVAQVIGQIQKANVPLDAIAKFAADEGL